MFSIQSCKNKSFLFINKCHSQNSKSNHPPTILKQIQKMVETRLSNNSINKNLFNNVKKTIDTLKIYGHNYEINYTKECEKKNIKRKTICSIPHIANMSNNT